MALDIVALEEWAKKIRESDYWTNTTITTNGTSIGGWGEYEYVPYEFQWYYDMPTSGYLRVENLLKDTEVFEMYVYNIILVDTEKCEVVHEFNNIIAESEKMAMLEVVMSADTRKLLKQGKLKFIFTLVGGFNKYINKK